MDKNTLWSLRLGFSNEQSDEIKQRGLNDFLITSFNSEIDKTLPKFLEEDPKTIKEIRAYRKLLREASSVQKKKELRKQVQNTTELKIWWIDKIKKNANPLHEKMVCFWHNHFVSTGQKVKLNYWLYQHHMILQKNAFGNFKTLTKEIVKSNAIVRYLDNTDNRKGKINENLSRELLELFTLGIGNYTENDIKNGAKALAGLGIGNETAQYREKLENNEIITYFGKTGKFKADELIDIIFEQKNIPYRITKKILQWFIYDNPTEELIQYYGDYFRKVDFEIKPLLLKIITEEYQKDNAGSKIKDPLAFIMQLIHELGLTNIDSKSIVQFLRQQGMDLFDQPNVKGWDGGTAWLTSQTYLQRNRVADLLCNGSSLKRRKIKTSDNTNSLHPKIVLKPTSNDATKIIDELSNRLFFSINESTQKDMQNILKYDFDPNHENAQNSILRLFNYIIKTPEFQIL